jgi:hypothetical protein
MPRPVGRHIVIARSTLPTRAYLTAGRFDRAITAQSYLGRSYWGRSYWGRSYWGRSYLSRLG